jgi:hypothetical protein
MRSLALLCLVIACGEDNNAPMTLNDLSGASGDMTDLAFSSSCGFPGDQAVNSLGVGKFCQEISDCNMPGNPNWMANLCSTIDPSSNSHFCTTACDPTMAGQCGANAVCVCKPGTGCGCTPAKCAPKGDM